MLTTYMQRAEALGLCDERFLPERKFLLKTSIAGEYISYGWNNYKKTRTFQVLEVENGIGINRYSNYIRASKELSDEAKILLVDFGREVRRELLKANQQVREFTEHPYLFQPQAWHGLLFMDQFAKTGKLPGYREWKVVYFIRSYSRGDRNERTLRFGDKFSPPWDSYKCELYEISRYNGTCFLADWDNHASIEIVSKEKAKSCDQQQWITFKENKCYPLESGDKLPTAYKN